MSVVDSTEKLADLNDVVIDKTLPVEIKKQEFLRQVNPYLCRVDNVVITSIFDPAAPPLVDAYKRLKA